MEAANIAAVPVLLLLLSSAPCSIGQPRSAHSDTTTVPGLTVALSLSRRARQTLVSRKETIIVSADVTGFPKPGTPKHLIDGEGQVDLGDFTAEILPGQNGDFKSLSLKSAPLRYTDKRGPQLLVNVYSGRKSSPNNLIDCGIYEGPLSAAQNKSIPIACKLIGE